VHWRRFPSAPVFLLLLGLAACSSHLPAIDDPAQLVKDCAALDASTANGNIDSGKWPATVQALKPAAVTRQGDSIIISTFQATGQGVRGYIVNSGAQPTFSHYKLSPAYPGIYRFEFVP
jgi:hypothetical protein